MQEYRPIVDFENYEISNLGNVRNIKTEKILKNCINNEGYYQVNLYKDKKRTTKTIHQLVANTFIENPENKFCVDHINNDKLDNNVNNLRWATSNENQHNRKISKNNTSGIKGVYFDRNANKWRAQLKIDGIKIYIGSFENIKSQKLQELKPQMKRLGFTRTLVNKNKIITFCHITSK